MDNQKSDYEKCITRSYYADSVEIECKLGLWSVESGDVAKAEAEAMHYWRQYAHDGEYSSIIGGKTVKQVLMYQKG